MMQLGQFLKEVLRDYAKRFWIFWTVLYIAMVLVELSRQVFLEMLSLSSGVEVAGMVLANEILGNPYLAVPLLAMFLFDAWGFGSLYFSFSEVSAQEAIRSGFKNLHRYAGFIIVAGLITVLGFILLSTSALWLIDTFTNLPLYLADGETLNLWLALPLVFVLGIPGIYLLVAFSNAPLILLLERRGIWGSLKESVRRVTPRWFMAAIYLLVSLAIAGAAYYLLSWLVFSLKLAFIPDLSLRGESMLRAFLYVIPWVVVASFYDLALYHLYRRLYRAPAVSDVEGPQLASVSSSGSRAPNYFSVLKIVSVIVLFAFVMSFVLVPFPVQAGGFFGKGGGLVGFLVSSVIGYFIGPVVSSFLCGPAAPFCLVMAGMLSVASEIHASQSCRGSYDPIFGICSKKKREDSQKIFVTKNVKFTKVEFPDIPTPSEFAANPNSMASITFHWQADAQPGLVNYFSVVDTVTNQIFRGNCTGSGSVGNVCRAGPVTTTCELPYEKDFQAQIWLASCWQIAAKVVRPTCGGCEGDIVGVRYDFTTPALPLPRVDIKANNKDGDIVFTPGTPITLSWISEYALEAEASGSWSGSLPLSGSQTVTPQTGNEVYTVVVKRGDKSGSDSVSSAPATPQIQIFDSKGGGSGGGSGALQIKEFNITDPLNPGDTVTISWSVSGAESCEVDNGIGQIPTVGSVDVVFLKTVTFTITCMDSDGNAVSAQRTVNVKKVPGVKEIKPE